MDKQVGRSVVSTTAIARNAGLVSSPTYPRQTDRQTDRTDRQRDRQTVRQEGAKTTQNRVV